MPRRTLAASLAALAESGVVFLFVVEVSSEAAHATRGPLTSYPLFVALFVGGVAVGSLARGIRVFASVALAVAVALGLAQGIGWARVDLLGGILLVVVMLLGSLRVVALVRRDWSDPVEGSFLGGAALLLVEVALAPSAVQLWQRLMPVVVLVFFAASLASRAVSMTVLERSRRISPPAGPGRAEAAVTLLFLAALGGALAAAGALGTSNGILQRLGGPVYAVTVAVVVGLGFVTARLLYGPAYLIFSLFHLNLAPLRALAQRLHDLAFDPGRRSGIGPGWVTRLLGLLFLGAIAFLVVRMTRRWLARLERDAAAPDRLGTAIADRVAAIPRPGGRPGFLRRELPADVVRRWYAEALVALERRGLARPPGATPAEYLGGVARAFPGCRFPFGALTRAYEDVRYGSITVDREVLRRLDEGRAAMMEAFRRAEPVVRPPAPS